ncbi:hypothetical protein NQZ79_g8679 [Umbelopsis isabellina]|nr:hypothetical protein NQZ79_g8679 [Umbelopsis isabellina]
MLVAAWDIPCKSTKDVTVYGWESVKEPRWNGAGDDTTTEDSYVLVSCVNVKSNVFNVQRSSHAAIPAAMTPGYTGHFWIERFKNACPPKGPHSGDCRCGTNQSGPKSRQLSKTMSKDANSEAKFSAKLLKSKVSLHMIDLPVNLNPMCCAVLSDGQSPQCYYDTLFDYATLYCYQ